MEEVLCLAGIVVRGSTRWCELPKYHEGSHIAKGEDLENVTVIVLSPYMTFSSIVFIPYEPRHSHKFISTIRTDHRR